MKRIKSIFALIHTELHKNSFFKQLLFSYIVISCITFLVFSIAILYFTKEQHLADMQDINKKNIEQAYNLNNSILQDISSYCYTALDSATVKKLLYSDEYDITTAINSRETYENFLEISSTILSIDFINFMNDTVLTKTGRHSLKQFKDQELISLLQEISPRKAPYFCYPREIPYQNSNYTENRRVISLIYYFNNNGALVVNLDYDTYCSLLNINYNDAGFQLLLVNSDNKIIASTDSNQFMLDFQSMPLCSQIEAVKELSGTLTYTDKSSTYSVCYHKATPMGITYISMFSHENYLDGNSLYSLTLRFSILFLVVTILLSFLSSYIIYNPIQKLKTTVHPIHVGAADVDYDSKNDFDFLESVYKQLTKRNIALSQYERNYTEEKQQKLLWALLNNKGMNSPSPQELESLDACFEHLNYIVFIIHIEMTPSQQNEAKDIQLYKFIIQNVTNELFETHTPLKYVETTSSQLIFVGNPEHYDKPLLLETAQQIQQFFSKADLFRLSFGFSSPVTEFESLPDAYRTAQTALINGRINTTGCIQFYDELQLLPPHMQQYPYEADQNILAALKSQNRDACFQALDQFFAAIQNHHYNQIHRSILQLDITIQRFEYINELPPASWNAEKDVHFLPTLEELKNTFQLRCEANMQALAEIKTHSLAKNELISHVNSIIEENIYNPNLSVAMIAEEVALSVNYLRNIYKENTGTSLTTYIADRKLTLICDMLSNTDIPIQDISDKLGFTTKNYFFTFFKKHMNMTPTQYRSMHSNQ